MRFLPSDTADPAPTVTVGSGAAPPPETVSRRRPYERTLDDLHLDAPAIDVLLDCECREGAEAVDGVVATGADGSAAVAVFRAVPHAAAPAATDARWTMALAMLDDAFGGDAPFEDLPIFQPVSMASIVGARLARRRSGQTAHLGVRHYFEAIAAIALPAARAPGGVPGAAAWNALASPLERGRYRYEISRETRPWRIDLRGAVRDVLFEVLGGETEATIAARFQNTVAAALCDVVRAIGGTRGRVPVVLHGTCFGSGELAGRLGAELSPDFDLAIAP